jgi:excisionase family DNA binding protein
MFSFTIVGLASWLRLSKNRAYILARRSWFPRTYFLGRLVLDEALVKRAVRARLYHPPIPELAPANHTTLLTLGETARTLEQSKATLRRLIRQRKIGFYDVGRLLVPAEEIERVRPLFRKLNSCQSGSLTVRFPTEFHAFDKLPKSHLIFRQTVTLETLIVASSFFTLKRY